MEKMVDSAFWANKTVLITGHTGFKGSWLTLWLQHLGAKVIGFSLEPPTELNAFTALRVRDGISHHIGDVRDLAALQRILADSRPHIVIHLAAQALVRPSYQTPVDTYATNVMGSVHVLEAVRQTSSVKALLNVTSDKCYANQEWLWGYRESEALGGHDPYSSSKACAELVTAAYRQSYFQNSVGIASARAGNVIGGGDWAPDRLLPDVLRSCDRGEALTLRYPHAIRPWQHVLEPLSGYLCLAQALYEQPEAYSEAWNFGPNDPDTRSVEWVVHYVTQRLAPALSIHIDASRQPHETTRLQLDCSQARARLAWRPRWTLPQALDSVIAWHQAYRAGSDMRAVSLSQIQHYGEALHG